MPFHAAAPDDLEFRNAFESGGIQPGDFSHMAHLRLAYVYLVEGDTAHAERRMRISLLAFLDRYNIPRSKFHETLTYSWVMAVSHFMNRSKSESFQEFLTNSQPLLDSKVMLTHYSPDILFSEAARESFIEPDLQAIPQ